VRLSRTQQNDTTVKGLFANEEKRNFQWIVKIKTVSVVESALLTNHLVYRDTADSACINTTITCSSQIFTL
jgi:hypothetical protein